MKIVILGGGNSFALETARALLGMGHEIIAIGRSPLRPECFTLEFARPHDRFEYHTYHVAYDLDYIVKLLHERKPQIIINFAAQGEAAASFGDDAWRYFETNCTALTRLVCTLGKYVENFIHIGSPEVYGSVEYPVTEAQPLNPSSPYAASKAGFDYYLLTKMRDGFPATILRPSNVYAKGQQLHRLIPKALLCAVTGSKFRLNGGGNSRKGYLYGSDLAAAIVLVLHHPGGIYNLGPDAPVMVRDIVEECCRQAGRSFAEMVEMAPERHGRDAVYWLDSSKIKALGWTQKVSLETGIAAMHGWVRKYKDTLALQPTAYRARS